MNIVIRNNDTHRETYYTQAQLKTDARLLVKPYGKLNGFDIAFMERGNAQLIASYIKPDGGLGSVTMVI